jgi:hypothetical protein
MVLKRKQAAAPTTKADPTELGIADGAALSEQRLLGELGQRPADSALRDISSPGR